MKVYKNAIVWDWGGVIGANGDHFRCPALLQATGRTPEELNLRYHNMEQALYVGAMTTSDFWTALCQSLDVSIPISTLLDEYNATMSVRKSYLDLTKQFSQSEHLLCSNIGPDGMEWIFRTLAVEDFFVWWWFSCLVGLRKPQPSIFYRIEQWTAFPVSRHCLVDDSEENCSAARARGWTSIKVDSTMSATTIAGQIKEWETADQCHSVA